MKLHYGPLLVSATIIVGLSSSWAQQPHSLGVETTVLFNNGQQRVTRLAIPAGKTVDPHIHPGDEIGLVKRGTLTVKVAGGRCTTYLEGGVFRVPPKVPMTVTNNTSEDAVLLSLLLDLNGEEPVQYEQGETCAQK